VAPRAQVTASLQPWARQPVLQAQARVQQLDLAPLWPGAPRTRLQGDAQVRPQGERWQALLQLENTLPGPWNEQTLPVRQARASVVYTQGAWTIESLQAQGAGGSLGLQGRVGAPVAGGPGPSWTARAQWTGINPALADSRLAPAALAGSGDAGFDGSTWTFTVSLQPAGPQPAASPLAGLRLQRASAHGSWGAGWLRLPELQLQTDDASLQGQLEIQPASRSGQGRLQLRLPGGQGRLEGQMAPRTGSGTLTLDIADAAQAGAWLRRLPVAGLAAALPALRGQGDLAVDWQGGWQDLQAGPDGSTRVQARLRVPALALQSAGADPAQLRDADIRVAGTLAAWSGSASGRLQRGPQQLLLASQVRGDRAPDGLLQLTIDRAQADLDDSRQPGRWSLSLQAPLPMQWQAGRLQTAPAQARLSGPLPGSATLQLDAIRWSPGAPGRLASQGQLRDLPLAWLTRLGDLPLERLGLSGNLVFDANWDLALADTLRLRASLARRSGDIRVLAERLPGSLDPGTTVDAGVRDARIDLRIDGETVNSTLRWDSERAGSVQAEFGTRLVRDATGWDWPLAAPLNGSVQARLPQVGVWSLLAPPGWRMRGTLDAGLTLAGTRQAPDWSGRLQADGLALRSVVDGIEFGNGRLRARMQGQRLFIEEFLLQGAGGAVGGTLSATGHAQWVPGSDSDGGTLSRIQIDLDAQAQALRVSARADRRLVVSGQLQARLRSNRLDVQGRLQADQALFVLPDETAPRLGDDVVIATRAAPAGAEAATPRSPAETPGAGVPVQTTLALALALGPDFRVQGRGIVTRLAGTLQLRAAAGEAPQLQGEVRTMRGSYKAYGQLLDVEQGVLRFNGRYDNPALDILAVRPNLTQRVGVQITGTAAVPRVRLFSEPEMAEAEKLAWLVLGRSGANGGAEAAVLQQAALALLGRNGQGLSGGLATALGLDELSIAAAATRADGSTSAATVTLGKRLSRDFYVAYERSLAGTLGTISIFYDLSRRFTLRASTGEQSAIDLIFTLRYD
jgi:translocation and assembly module TamB